jgi:hypothetical protein
MNFYYPMSMSQSRSKDVIPRATTKFLNTNVVQSLGTKTPYNCDDQLDYQHDTQEHEGLHTHTHMKTQ